jgi:hypothetical protein
MLGLSSLLPGSSLGGSSSSGQAGGGLLASTLRGAAGQDAAYGAARCAAEAVMDELEERAAWAAFKVR